MVQILSAGKKLCKEAISKKMSLFVAPHRIALPVFVVCVFDAVRSRELMFCVKACLSTFAYLILISGLLAWRAWNQKDVMHYIHITAQIRTRSYSLITLHLIKNSTCRAISWCEVKSVIVVQQEAVSLCCVMKMDRSDRPGIKPEGLPRDNTV